jgi:vacuolar-type H+-ATPase subunit E/Vma4
MSQQRLIGAMEEETVARIAHIERETEQAIREIDAEVDDRLAEAEDAEKKRSRKKLLEYQHRQRSRFENRWRGREQNLRFELAEHVFHDVENALAPARDREDYPAIWRRLFEQALRTYREERTDKPILRVVPADRELADSQEPEVQAIELDDKIRDGVELASPDRALHVKNTLDSRLRKGREQFLKMISDALKGKMSR